MIGYANTDGAALRVLELARHFACRRQNKCVASGNTLFHDAKLPVVESSVASNFGEIATQDRQMMLVVDSSQRAYAPRAGGVTHLASKRIARVGRVRDHSPVPDDGCRSSHEPRLRI